MPTAVMPSCSCSPPSASAATHLEVTVPENVSSGQSFDVRVVAEDAGNHTATGYTGSVQLKLGTTDAGAKLPAAYTFTTADHGSHLFHVTLAATGSQTITATDTHTSSITGKATTQVTPAPVATRLLVQTPKNATTGKAASVTVQVLDAAGHPVTNYTGTVRLTSSDTKATLPANYTFTARDRGQHTFQVTFNTTGTQTVTATDTHTGSITGQAALTVCVPPVSTPPSSGSQPSSGTGPTSTTSPPATNPPPQDCSLFPVTWDTPSRQRFHFTDSTCFTNREHDRDGGRWFQDDSWFGGCGARWWD